MNEKFTRFSSASVGTTTRTDHLRELENAVDKLQKFKNASAINRSYHDANVIPKALGSNRFPIGIYPDLTYKSEFANLINKFQLEILDFNHKHITENIEELENKVSGILDVIGMYDHHIKTKYNIFKSQSESKHKANLTDSMEKFQNTSKKALVHINQDSESIQSEPDISVIDSTNAQPTASHKHQRNKKKNNNINRNNIITITIMIAIIKIIIPRILQDPIITYNKMMHTILNLITPTIVVTLLTLLIMVPMVLTDTIRLLSQTINTVQSLQIISWLLLSLPDP